MAGWMWLAYQDGPDTASAVCKTDIHPLRGKPIQTWVFLNIAAQSNFSRFGQLKEISAAWLRKESIRHRGWQKQKQKTPHKKPGSCVKSTPLARWNAFVLICCCVSGTNYSRSAASWFDRTRSHHVVRWAANKFDRQADRLTDQPLYKLNLVCMQKSLSLAWNTQGSKSFLAKGRMLKFWLK